MAAKLPTRPAARRAPGPASDTRQKPSSKVDSAWCESVRNILGEVQTGTAVDLENDRNLLQNNKSENERRDASPNDNDNTNIEDLDQVRLPETQFLSLEPEILKVLYQRHADSLKARLGIDLDQPPLYRIKDIFDDVAKKAEQHGFGDVLSHLGSRKLRVVTVCSGTESPLLALKMFSDSFYQHFGKTLDIEHLFSAEIVPFKQAYIERNFHPPILFRDVKELKQPMATTAYGAIREVPVGADLLVAGFSCVDYSNLNKRRKQAGEVGESRDTFYATLNYAKKCRPPIVVLENVSGAPWPSITRDWEKIGYSATHVRVDTKSYYLPQTRERGYMLCVDKSLLKKLPRGSDPHLAWMELMGKFKRPASSPVDKFLLEDDDPRVQQIRREMASRNNKEGQVHDWSAYKTRHQAYRMQEQLGNKRPVTRWQDNGSCKMPDFAWKDWSKFQPERVWDTIDMNFLRSIYRGYDLSYKLRVLELSQGIDRETDRRAFGVVGCITPSGIPYITTRGGPLLGIEALSVQGIPVNDLLLTRETQRELQDLAGNAMSTTAIGAAIISALLVGFRTLPSGTVNSPQSSLEASKSEITALNDQYMAQQLLDLSSFGREPVKRILDSALKGSRLCICEGRTSIAAKDLKVCSRCAHTACVDCAGNPSHEYSNIPVQEANARELPTEVANQIKDCLPMRFVVQGILIDDFNVFMHPDSVCHGPIWDKFLKVVQSALGEILNFQDITRGKTWIVRYDGAYSSANLVLSARSATWFLYVKTPPAEASNSILRQMLSQPIAKMSARRKSLFIGQWKISAPISSSMSLSISGEGEKRDSWGSKAGLQHEDHSGSTVWSQLRICADEEDITDLGHDIRGVYDLLPDCGSASSSLHRKTLDDESSPPMFLFLDPTKLGLPELDSFVFSWDHDRLDHKQSRVRIAEMSPLWRPSQVYEDPTIAQCFYRKEVVCEGASIRRLRSDPKARFRTPSSDFVLNLGGTACHEARISLLDCSIPTAGSDLPWKKGNWSVTNLMESPSMLQGFAWMIQKFRSITPFAEWREPTFQVSGFENCATCAPVRPSIEWVVDSKKSIKPYEDPVEAGVYERQLKARPPPFMAFTRIDENGIGHFKLCVNATTLIHQASAKLNMGSGTSLYWRVLAEDASIQDAALPPFKIKGNRDNAEHAQPPGFKTHKLRPDQLRSLNWMIEQEKHGVSPFLEEEVEEAVLGPMNWRAEGLATASKVVHGGVLADDVGYGKTATVLGLIDSQSSKGGQKAPVFVDGFIPSKATLIVVPDVLIQQWRSEISKFLGKKYKVLVISQIQSLGSTTIDDVQNADIVLATWAILHGKAYYEKLEQFSVARKYPDKPGRIFSTWFADALVRLADHVNILRSGGPKVLLESIRHKRQEMETNEAYSMYTLSKRLRGSAYVEDQERKEAKTVAGRQEGFKRKREDEADDNNDVSHGASDVEEDDGDGENCGTVDNADSARDADEGEAIPPKGRNDGKVFGLSELPGKKNWKMTRSPLLHMFEFNRVVVDEFTYAGNRSYITLVALRSKAKWILSGTPPLNNFADVKTISPFLGINLGVDDDGSAKQGNTRLKELQQGRSDAEQFHSFKAPHSAAWHRRRHEVAQKFLDKFMRQNAAEIDEIPWTEHICPVVLTSAERAIYIELYIQLMSQKLNPRKGIHSGLDNDQAKRLNDLIKDSKTPREALQKRCSMFDPGNLSSNNNDATLSCNSIIRTRERQIGELGLDIEKKFRLALWLQRNYNSSSQQFENLKGSISNNSLGDEAVATELQQHLSNSIHNANQDDGNEFYRTAEATEVKGTRRKKPKKATNKEKAKMTEEEQDMAERLFFPVTQDDFKEDLRQVSATLRKLFDEAISRARALRLLKAIRSFQELKPREPTLRNCSKCGYQPPPLGNMCILGQCGHVFCEPCIADAQANEQCMVEFCQGSAQAYHILKSEDLGRDEAHTKCTPYGGKKFGELVKLLQDTKRIAKDDQVILFVQFEQLMKAAKIALEANNITHSAISATGTGGGKIVEAFKKEISKGKTQRPKVLILNLSGETAAGLNLQNANHVIFLSPVLTDSQYDYDSTMTQTIGRCRRFGQKKRVHIYHFLALETIDVNVLQHRRNQVLVQRDGEFLLVPEDQVLVTDKANWRGSSLDGVHARGHLEE